MTDSPLLWLIGFVALVTVVSAFVMLVDLVVSAREACRKLRRIINLLEEQVGCEHSEEE